MFLAVIGYYLLGTGFYDLFIDHDTAEVFRKGMTVHVSLEAAPDQFHRLVSYRLFLGTLAIVLTGVLNQLRRWCYAD